MFRRPFLIRVAAATAVAAPLRAKAQSDSGSTPIATGEGTVTDSATPAAASTPTSTGYAPANGLQMYHEIHGEPTDAPPVLLLNGAYMTTGTFGPFLPGLAAGRQVIVTDLQGHGRTGDIDRPITYETMADDCAALLNHLGIAQVDAVGYSMGGGTAIQLAIRHPEVVRTLVPISAGYRHDGMQPELIAMLPTLTVDAFIGSPFETTYKEVAPNPDDFPTLVRKLVELDSTPFAWDADIPKISAPTLIVMGDSDASSVEHGVAMFRLMGGGAMGDFVGIPKVRLAVLPGTSHFIPEHIGMLARYEWLLAIIPHFLDAPDPVPAPSF
jgi:pimeloyl-ACP methyl ester carboxylesterase